MFTLSEKEVEKIAAQLLKGMICFYQLDNKKIYQLPDDEDYFNYDLTPEEEDILDEIDENPENYAEFTKMEPHQEHQMMETFADRIVKERNFQDELFNALSKPKAATAFKFLIDSSGKYKDRWLEYRLQKYQDWVKEQIDIFNFSEE
jgi:mRNA-degrading endonuclease RelE of RelBE toxin-antitoxin system